MQLVLSWGLPTVMECLNKGLHWLVGFRLALTATGIMLCMCPANEIQSYIVTSSVIGWAGAYLRWTATGIILCMCPANKRWRDIVTSSLIGWAHTQNDPCSWGCGEVFFGENVLWYITMKLLHLQRQLAWWGDHQLPLLYPMGSHYIPHIRRIGGCYGFTSKPPVARRPPPAARRPPPAMVLTR